jgi:undecaprenyl-diphosphatase
MNGQGMPWLDAPMRVISTDPFFWAVGALVLYGAAKRLSLSQLLVGGAWFALGLVLSDAISVHFFKDVVERLRPCHDPLCQDSLRLVADACRGKFGFVSSHATNAAALVVLSQAFSLPRWAFPALILWMVLTGWSRVHLGVHFPGDILGGWLVGAAWATLWIKIRPAAWNEAPTSSSTEA